jgi:1-deoxy-D-xylulose-5-phosphate synthase
MGFYYIGPVDGHDIAQLSRAFETARTFARPVVVHVQTVKGKGYAFAEKDPGSYHGVGRFDPAEKLVPSTVPSFSTVFGETIDTLAEEDARIVGITAAMKHGTCMLQFAERVPSRCFDTGIAESHAVTFASGMAVGGLIPIFAVYSTFLQRAYDQLLNDTAIMHNHIVLAVDRAGIVPEEGETHQGVFDVAFLSTVPNTVIYAPATFEELKLHLKKAVYEEDGIAAVRYPRGSEPATLSGYTPAYTAYTLEETDTADTLVITYGREYGEVITAASMMAQNGHPVSVLKLNRIFPVADEIIDIVKRYNKAVFVEEGAKRGGLGEQVAALLMENGFKGTYTVRAVDGFIPPCTLEEGMKRYGLDAESIYTLLAQG